jgi:alpha-1,2-mannosyltransferase
VAETSRTDRIFTVVIGVAVVAAIAVIVARDLLSQQAGLRLDFYVYHESVQSMLSGKGLYEFSLTIFDGQFPFTYPPFAALVLVPIALVPVQIGQAIWMAFQLVLSLGLVWLALSRPLPGRLPAGWKGWALIVTAWLVVLANAPITQSVLLGQLSLTVVGLVLLDFLVVPPRFRGILTGLAGAIKLLPLIYLPYFLVTRQWRAAANTAGSFFGATGIAFLVLPQESVQFWTEMVFQTQRVGDLVSMRNKSLLGNLTQWGIAGTERTVLWLLLGAALVAIGLWRARRHHQRGEEFAAMLVVGLLAGIVSPISWVHHLAWLTFVMLYLAQLGSQVWMAVAAAMAIGFCFLSPVATSEYGGPLWFQVLQTAMLATMIAFVMFGLPASGRRPEALGVADGTGNG